MAGKEFSIDFEQLPTGLSENHKLMIEDPITGKEYWVAFSVFLSIFAQSGGLKDTLKDVSDRIPVLINAAIAALVDGAPDSLNTLRELAEALKNEQNLSAVIINTLSEKVDKIQGKSLSTNDYTNDEKAEVSKIKRTVSYDPQAMDTSERARARQNIDAANQQEFQNLANKVYSTNYTQLATSYTWTGYALKSNGQTVSANGYIIKRYGVSGKEKIKVNGVSLTNDFCLCCFFGVNDNFIAAIEIGKNAIYNQFELNVPTGSAYVLIMGDAATPPMCFGGVVSETFYTKQQSDELSNKYLKVNVSQNFQDVEKLQARKNIDVNKTFFTVPTSEVTNGDRLILNDKEYIRIDNAWVSLIPLINRYSDNAILDFSKILDIEAEILDLQNISSSNQTILTFNIN